MCCFCGGSADASVPGGLAELIDAAMPRTGEVLRFHEACAGYSSGIAAGRLTPEGRVAFRHGELQAAAERVAAEAWRGARLRCSACGGQGATVGCRSIHQCGRTWHLPCARAAAQDFGGGGAGVVFSSSVLECACDQHADRCARWVFMKNVGAGFAAIARQLMCLEKCWCFPF